MQKNLRWKVITILSVVLLFFAVGVYPILAQRYGLKAPGWLMAKQLRLGLDLKGGVHLVLRVQTDDALRLETDMTAERLREELAKRGALASASVRATSATQFRVEGIAAAQDQEFRRASDEQTQAVFNREPEAGGAYTFSMKPNVAITLRNEAVDQARQTIERRVNALGVAEPIVAPHGSAGDQILVQLPGVTEVARAKEIIRSTAQLSLKMVEQGPASTKEALLQSTNGVVPPDMELITGAAEVGTGDAGSTLYYLVKKVPVVTGRDLRNARPTLDENNMPAVGFSLKRDGAQRFGAATGANIGRNLAIILDGRVQSAPVIEGRIDDEGRIAGSFTQQEANDLSLVLKSGALPANLTYLEQREVGPSLGADSIRAGVLASLAGLGFVAAFMLVYYKLAGINAILSIVINLIILLGFMAYLGAIMTLPGVAGFILTIGMGVDSNVLIFERIKEELAAGRGVKQAVGAGFDRVFLTILDTHIASLIAAAFLFQFGTGPIRGFATTLTFGLLSNVFTAVFVSRTIFELALARRQVTRLSI